MNRRSIKAMVRAIRRLLSGKRKVNYHAEYFNNDPIVDHVIRVERGLLELKLKSFRRLVYARDYPHSDINVAKQVLIDDEYKPVIDFIKGEFTLPRQPNIIDGGANVGYFTFYVKEKIPGAYIACIEPDNGNVETLKRNLNDFIEAGEVVLYKNGLGPKSNISLTIDRGFRGGSDWSLTVKESSRATELKSITVPDILRSLQWDRVDLLKIDIEGGERFLFNSEADLSYLESVRAIALEIHDEFNIRDSIYEILKRHDFTIRELGETTLFLNQQFGDRFTP